MNGKNMLFFIKKKEAVSFRYAMLQSKLVFCSVDQAFCMEFDSILLMEIRWFQSIEV